MDRVVVDGHAPIWESSPRASIGFNQPARHYRSRVMQQEDTTYMTPRADPMEPRLCSAHPLRQGIKLLSAHGTKLTDADEDRIEERIRNPSTRIPGGDKIGTRFFDKKAFDNYVSFLASTAKYSYRGLEIVVDGANGAAFRAAPAMLRKLHASVEEWAVEPDGTNINLGCGSTHPEFLAAKVNGRIGLAFDGDADRLLAFDEDGLPLNGDVIMAIIARHWKAQGRLKGNLVVARSVHLGFRRQCKTPDRDGRAKVGDRYVLKRFKPQGVLAANNPPIIFSPRDAPATALDRRRLLDVVAGTGLKLRSSAQAMTEYPQVLRNVKVGRGVQLDGAKGVWKAARQAEKELGDDGRVLVRASGTEPVVRVMVEASSQDSAVGYADRLAEVVARELAS